MTLPRLYALTDYWKSAPPVAESVAAYLGIKAPTKIDHTANASALQEFISREPGGIAELPR